MQHTRFNMVGKPHVPNLDSLQRYTKFAVDDLLQFLSGKRSELCVFMKCWYGVKQPYHFAINEFREMKMQPSLERALKHKEILGA